MLLKADQFLAEVEKTNQAVAKQEQGFTKSQAALVTLNQTVNLAERGFTLLGRAFDSVASTIERGQAFYELSAAFDTLYGSSQALGNDGLGKLREALQGTVSDLDILKSANQAAQAGLKAEDFLVVAQAAETLGDKLGKGPNEALGVLSRALATGQERQLKFLVGTIDTAKVQEDFAKTLGTTADKLSETGKLAAVQAEVIRRLKEEIANAGEATLTAGDGLERLNVQFDNAKTRFAAGVNQTTELGENLDKVAKVLSTFPWEEFGRKGGDVLAALTTKVAAFTKNFLLAVDDFFDVSLVAKVQRISEISQEINKIQDTLASRKGGLFGAAANAALKGQLEDLGAEYVDLVKEIERMGLAQEAVTKKNDNAGESAADAAGNIDKLTKSAKEAKDAVTAIITGPFDILTGLERIDIFNQLGLNVGAEMREELNKQWPKIAEDAKEKLNDRFQESADFFSETLYNSMTGAAFDIEDLFKRIFAGIAGGFLSQITGGFGAGLGTPQGIGQLIGASLANGTGLNLGGLLPGAAGAAANIGPVASGAQYGAALSGAGGFSLTSVLSSITTAGPAIVAGIGVLGALGRLQEDPGGFGKPGTKFTGFNGPEFILGQGQSILGIGGGLSEQQLHLGGIVDALIEKGVLGDEGTFSLFGGGQGRLQASRGGDLETKANSLGGLAGSDLAGLGNLFSILTQGDVDEQFAGLFANALTEAGSFNEALLTTAGLLDKAGISGEQAGQLITDAYLDGTLSIEEYNSALNLATQLELDHLDSLEESADLLAASFGGAPRDSLRALQIEFQTLATQGIDSAAEVVDYFTNTFGPEAGQSIQDIVDSGIDLFSDFSSLTVPEIQLIVNEINQMRGAFEEVGEEGEGAAERTARGFRRVGEEAGKARKQVQGLTGDLRNASTAGSGVDSPGVQ